MSAGATGAVAAVIDDLYDAVLHRDRDRFDGHLAPGVTIWESHVPAMMHGVAELSAYRDRRDADEGPAALASLAADDKLVDIIDGTALARYRLVARADATSTEFRVTDVLRHDGATGGGSSTITPSVWRRPPRKAPTMADPSDETVVFDLRVTVDRIEGRSACGMQPGDCFDLVRSNELRLPDGRHFCIYALAAVLPMLAAKQRQLPPATGWSRTPRSAAPTPTSGW